MYRGRLLLITVHELNIKLDYLSPFFFFLQHGLESAIVTALEDFGESTTSEYLKNDDAFSSFILTELEKHFIILEKSNSLPSNWQGIYDAVKLASGIIKDEVGIEVRNLLGSKPIRVLGVKRLNKYDCLLNVVYD